ncbi:MAG: precorrin-3B C(17)-methyltransferase [Lachnospiraceae bacterium]|nr:precorrin-3B C(17)-methyltransferase [Lachnospiraceae bacterium]
MGKIYIAGIGPGSAGMMTRQAEEALAASDVIIGYRTYTDLVKDRYPDKEYIESGMRDEIGRCEKCVELAKSGKTIALICSGDPGVYGMASPLLEIAQREGFDDVEVVPGITAALSGAAALGAPLANDFCVISLSDLLTPWDVIEKRLESAASAGFSIAIYNPASHGRADHLKKACEILMRILPGSTACGYAKNIGRDGMETGTCMLSELSGIPAGMTTTVFIGNAQTKISCGRLITPRGYEL